MNIYNQSPSSSDATIQDPEKDGVRLAFKPKNGIEALIYAATMAPSGDNTQSLRYGVDQRTKKLRVGIDADADGSPFDSGNFMSRISLGAALENIMQTLAYNSLPAATFQLTNDLMAADINVAHLEDKDVIEIPREITERNTNRKIYEDKPVDKATLELLEGNSRDFSNLQIHWIDGKKDLKTANKVIYDGTHIALKNKDVTLELIKTLTTNSRAKWGMPHTALEAKEFEIKLLMLLGKLHKYCTTPLPFLMATSEAKKLEKISGILVITSKDAKLNAQEFFDTGRLAQRIWLNFTKHQIQAQPFMGFVGLRVFNQPGYQKLHETLASSLPVFRDNHPTWVMRFGFAAPSAGVSNRLDPNIDVHPSHRSKN